MVGWWGDGVGEGGGVAGDGLKPNTGVTFEGYMVAHCGLKPLKS